VALSDDVTRIAAAATDFAAPGEALAAVLVSEPRPSERLYLCAFASTEGTQSWLALDESAAPVTSRQRVRDAASIAALCEVAEESAGIGEGTEPRIASLSYLDGLGADGQAEALALAVRNAMPVVDELTRDVEGNYKLELAE
jgi:hypothetical protein